MSRPLWQERRAGLRRDASATRDLTDRAYMSSLSDEELLNVIKHGGASVGKSPAMMAFAEVLNDDIRDLVAYLRPLCCQ